MIAQASSISITNDQVLARLARAGNLAAFESLLRKWQPPLLRFLQRRVGNRSDAEDLFQETFIRVYQHLADFDERRSFKTWIYTIAWRLTANHLRDQHPRGELTEDHPSPGSSPLDDAAGGELQQALWATARQVLSPAQFDLLWLCYAEDLPPREIAKVTGKSWLAVKTALHRARRTLAPHLHER